MGKKIWYTIHPRKFGFDVSVLRPSVHSLGVTEANQVSARRGEDYVDHYQQLAIGCYINLINKNT